MIGQKQRVTFLAVGAASFLLGLVFLVLGKATDEFALVVVGPCFMLTGVTWTIVILLAFKYAKIPQVDSAASPPEPEPTERTGGRIRLSESGFVDPTHCFCQVADEEMRPWVEKRYVEHVPTMALLQSTDDPHQKEVISIVSMLDVDNDTLLSMMGDVDKPDHHIIHCRENVRRMLGLE
ncbi:MAG: hypothetical protein QGH42_10280 [Kiritimatiellia bacterium]|jgi:hypothetical protein|nr:hypothetical protein [Kiritimatiellia bacterium]MDP6630597.1 hypothetical protein [Kiritimatiellia bacterium]MDP6811302.1 hypothetical protein [Kiritimatiellia bacterium]MDP7024608.1 hypothetical protein [Kiritimatiellia bacterium]